MDSESAIKRDYLEGLESIYAIGRLQNLGLSPKEAEKLIEKWDEENA